MFLLLFFNLVFGITDNCGTDTCSASIKKNGVEKFGSSRKNKADLLAWITSEEGKGSWGSDYTIELTDSSQMQSIIDKESLGRKAREVSQRILDLITGHNMGLNLTTPQIQTLKVTYASTKECLDDAQPWCAKAEIAGITPDGVIITQEVLDQINIIFSESGLPGL